MKFRSKKFLGLCLCLIAVLVICLFLLTAANSKVVPDQFIGAWKFDKDATESHRKQELGTEWLSYFQDWVVNIRHNGDLLFFLNNHYPMFRDMEIHSMLPQKLLLDGKDEFYDNYQLEITLLNDDAMMLRRKYIYDATFDKGFIFTKNAQIEDRVILSYLGKKNKN